MPAMPLAIAAVAGRSLPAIEGGGPSMGIFLLPGDDFAADEGSR